MAIIKKIFILLFIIINFLYSYSQITCDSIQHINIKNIDYINNVFYMVHINNYYLNNNIICKVTIIDSLDFYKQYIQYENETYFIEYKKNYLNRFLTDEELFNILKINK